MNSFLPPRLPSAQRPNLHSRGLVLWALALLAATGCARKTTLSRSTPGTGSPQALHVPRLAAVADSLARAQLAPGIIPGLSVAIARNGRVLLARGYGQADVEMGAAASAETVYEIRSLTKQFTAALIMRLVEAGKLSLDDPLAKYLPDYPLQGRTVTLRQLLNHTSGLTSLSSSLDLETALRGGNRQWFKLDLSYEEMSERFGKVPFEATPGEKFQYINLGYYLLSQVISKVTGTPYPAYVERELLQPLGLTHTRYADEHRVIANRAKGYEYYGGQLMNAPYVSSTALGVGAGGLCSTVGDLVRWTHLLHGGKVVSAASLAQMLAPTVLAGGQTVPYGFGLYRDRLGSHPKVYHGGTRPGFGTFLAHYPTDSLTIVVLNNAGSGRSKAEEVEQVLARTALGIRAQTRALSAPELARYEGSYSLQAGPRILELRVFTEGGELKGQATGQPVARLRPQGNHEFLVGEGDNIRLTFALDQGRAESVTLYQAGRAIPGKRKP